jgi:23S rRNA pseudouridine2605 synthase
MTQAGRQSSPRNGSGRNSSGRNEAKGGGTGRSNAGGFSGRGGSAGAGKRNFTQGEGRPFKASKPREAAPFDPDNPTTAGDYDRGQAARPAKPFRKPGSNKPGFGKAPGTPGALKPKAKPARQYGSKAFGSERFGQNLGPVRKPGRNRGFLGWGCRTRTRIRRRLVEAAGMLWHRG